MIILTENQKQFLHENCPGFTGEWCVESAGSAGSDRLFHRVYAPDRSASAVLIVWCSTDPDWERTFGIYREISVHAHILPEIIAHDEEHGLILVEDLGSSTLHRLLMFDAADPVPLFQKTINRLVQWQQIPYAEFSHLTSRAMDVETYLWETGYFAARCVTDLFNAPELLSPAFEAERHLLAERAATHSMVCLHRDFQSENIMLPDGVVRFIDYQGARLGAPWYDLASLVFDPYTFDVLSHSQRMDLVTYYHQQSGRPYNHAAFVDCAAQRLMQALGAYGNLSVHKGKTRYRTFVAPALANLLCILESDTRYPSITSIVRSLSTDYLKRIPQ